MVEKDKNNSEKNLDAEIQEFVTKVVKSFVRWDLINFFYYNPQTRDTVENIAKDIGQKQIR